MWPRMCVYEREDTQQARVVPVLYKMRIVRWLVLRIHMSTCAVGECLTWDSDAVLCRGSASACHASSARPQSDSRYEREPTPQPVSAD